MLPPLFARSPADPTEERRIRRLAGARHAPASWLERARIITLSWDGAQVGQIAAQLGCHPRTVYRWLHRFNAGGLDDLGDLPRSGRPRRLSELERGRIIALVASDPPGRLRRQPDGTLGLDRPEQADQAAQWTLDALAAAVRVEGIAVSRSQVRRILQADGGALAHGGFLEPQRRPTVRPRRAAIIILYTTPPARGDGGVRR